jgi:hypothetical protein
MRRFFNSLGNPFVAAVLRSPLHRMMSGRVMLITVRGRKTGREYTTPVEYKQTETGLEISSRPERTWWRNTGDGAPVRALVRGKWLEGEASATTEDGTVRVTITGLHPV